MLSSPTSLWALARLSSLSGATLKITISNCLLGFYSLVLKYVMALLLLSHRARVRRVSNKVTGLFVETHLGACPTPVFAHLNFFTCQNLFTCPISEFAHMSDPILRE